jgi:hypothetical protein
VRISVLVIVSVSRDPQAASPLYTFTEDERIVVTGVREDACRTSQRGWWAA